jgi:hypothetical protein
MKIKFETKGIECITPCPFIKDKVVGSYGCTEECTFFGDELREKEIRCTHPKLPKKGK